MQLMTILAVCLPLPDFAGGHNEHTGEAADGTEYVGPSVAKKQHGGKATFMKEHGGDVAAYRRSP